MRCHCKASEASDCQMAKVAEDASEDDDDDLRRRTRSTAAFPSRTLLPKPCAMVVCLYGSTAPSPSFVMNHITSPTSPYDNHVGRNSEKHLRHQRLATFGIRGLVFALSARRDGLSNKVVMGPTLPPRSCVLVNTHTHTVHTHALFSSSRHPSPSPSRMSFLLLPLLFSLLSLRAYSVSPPLPIPPVLSRPPFDTRASHSVHSISRECSVDGALLISAWWCHWCCRCVDVGVTDVLTSHRLILTLLRLILFLPSGIHVCTVIGVD